MIQLVYVFDTTYLMIICRLKPRGPAGSLTLINLTISVLQDGYAAKLY